MRTVAAWACAIALAVLVYVTLRPRWEYRIETYSGIEWRVNDALLDDSPSGAGRKGWEIISARWVDTLRGYECILRRRVFP